MIRRRTSRLYTAGLVCLAALAALGGCAQSGSNAAAGGALPDASQRGPARSVRQSGTPPPPTPTPVPTGTQHPPTPSPSPTNPPTNPPPTPTPAPTPTPPLITHVVVVLQENRTLDNLFNGFPGADTTTVGVRNGRSVNLVQSELGAKLDPCHRHSCFVQSYDNGAMDGFDDSLPCSPSCTPPGTSYAYVRQADVATYWQIAQQFALSDEAFEPSQGPSFPVHQYLIAGQAGRPIAIAENPARHPSRGRGGCSGAPTELTPTIDVTQPFPWNEGAPEYACLDYPTILDELDAAGISWRYYTPTIDSLWSAPEGVQHLARGGDSAYMVTPETKVLSDAAAHALPTVSYVVPRGSNSDHAGETSRQGGPDWVGTIVNTIEGDPYYATNTVVLITWDDWGGWYDHKAPQILDSYENGFRVPLIVVSPYVTPGVDHTPRTTVSIVTFLERLFGLPSLGTLDAQTDDLFGMFQFGARHRHVSHRAFRPVDTHGKTWRDYAGLPPDPRPVDEE